MECVVFATGGEKVNPLPDRRCKVDLAKWRLPGLARDQTVSQRGDSIPSREAVGRTGNLALSPLTRLKAGPAEAI
jgi:hypothetical protein